MISSIEVQHLTSLEKDIEETKASVSEFDTDISCSFNGEVDLTYYGSNPNPEDWSKYF